jgi:hypothetical protein
MCPNDDGSKATGKSWGLSEIHRLVPELGTRYKAKMATRKPGSVPNNDSIVVLDDDDDDDDFNWDLIHSPQ